MNWEGLCYLRPSSINLDFIPEQRCDIDEGQNYFRVHRPITHLTKIYIEPTTACNLNCITCFRNNWDLPEGKMSEETFELIYSNLEQMNPVPTIYFGGIGEPLFHQHTLDWIARVKKLGARVELITNGLLLTESRINKLVKAGLDTLWVSIDGATPETYADVRIGSQLPRIIENLRSLARKRGGGHFPKPEIGIAFLAMKRNITDLPKVIRLGISLKARYFSVSNLPACGRINAAGMLIFPNLASHILPALRCSAAIDPPQNGFFRGDPRCPD